MNNPATVAGFTLHALRLSQGHMGIPIRPYRLGHATLIFICIFLPSGGLGSRIEIFIIQDVVVSDVLNFYIPAYTGQRFPHDVQRPVDVCMYFHAVRGKVSLSVRFPKKAIE